MVNISLVTETIFTIGSFPITNTLLMSWYVVIALSIFAVAFSHNLKLVPGKFQNIVEAFIEAILGFVEQIQKVATDATSNDTSHRNIMRDDAATHEPGKYTKDHLAAAPAAKDDQVVVKQVLSRK